MGRRSSHVILISAALCAFDCLDGLCGTQVGPIAILKDRLLPTVAQKRMALKLLPILRLFPAPDKSRVDFSAYGPGALLPLPAAP